MTDFRLTTAANEVFAAIIPPQMQVTQAATEVWANTGQGLFPGLFNDSTNDAFYSPTVQIQGQPVNPSLVTDTDVVYAPVVAEQLVSAAVASDDVVYSPAVAGIQTIFPNLVNDALLTDVIYSMAAFEDQRIQPALRLDADVFYSPAVAIGSFLLPALYTATDTVYTPVAVGRAILPNLFVDTDVFYSPIARYNVTLHPPLVTDQGTIYPGEAFFQTSLGTTGGGGGSGAGLPANTKYASSLAITQSGRITGLQVTSTTASPTVHVRMGVYANSGGQPTTLLGYTDVLTGIVAGVNTLPLIAPFGGVSVAAGSIVWLAVNTDGTMNWFLASAANGSKYNTNTFAGGLSNPFGKTSNDNRTAPVTAIILIGNQQVVLTVNTVVVDTDTIYPSTVQALNAISAVYVDDATANDAVIVPAVSASDAVQPQLGVLSSDDVVYAPSVFEDSLIFAPLLTDVGVDTVFQPIIQTAAVQISTPVFSSDDVIYQPAVVDQGARVSPPFIGADDVIWSPTLAALNPLAPPLFTDTDTIFATVVTGAIWTLSPLLVDDSQYEFVWPPSVSILDTNFALAPALVVDTDVIPRPVAFFPGQLALTGIVLIASEEDRTNNLVGDGSI